MTRLGHPPDGLLNVAGLSVLVFDGGAVASAPIQGGRAACLFSTREAVLASPWAKRNGRLCVVRDAPAFVDQCRALDCLIIVDPYYDDAAGELCYKYLDRDGLVVEA